MRLCWARISKYLLKEPPQGVPRPAYYPIAFTQRHIICASLTNAHAHTAAFHAQIARRLKGSISSKISGYEDVLAGLVAEACIDVCPKNPNNFNVDNVRVIKIQVGRQEG